jgi:hypothetical protein
MRPIFCQVNNHEKTMQSIENKRAGTVLIAKENGFLEQEKPPFAEPRRIPILGDIPNGNSLPRLPISRLIPARRWEGES